MQGQVTANRQSMKAKGEPSGVPSFRWHRPVTLLVGGLLALIILQPRRIFPGTSIWQLSSPTPRQAPLPDFRWSTIIPERHLVYHDCYDGFQCARLDVPLDYNKTDTARIAIALVRLPAKIPITHIRYGGAIVINPGGPGGSGVERVLSAGRALQDLVDAERSPETALANDTYFDIIGFDPRGVNHSTPTVSCFPDSVSRQAWHLQSESEGVPGSKEADMHTLYQRARAFAIGCSNTLNSLPGYERFADHLNTPAVVVDMVEIIERHGEWRENQAKSDLRRQSFPQGQDAPAAILSRTRHAQGDEPLLFWGFSYGTLLGATFASIHPRRISRMILDGVVNSDAVYGGDRFDNLHDTDKILDRFFHYCSKAGPERCAFWREGGKAVIRERYNSLLRDVWNEPIPVAGSEERGPEIITYSDLKDIVRSAVYQPLTVFPSLATLLEDVASGDGSIFARYKQDARKPSYRTPACEAAGPYSSDCILPDWTLDGASRAILCIEAPGMSSISEEDFVEIAHRLRNQSAAIGDYWAQYLLGCAGWNATAAWLYDGPIGADTAHPILWIGNTFDPVTPLRNAKKMAAKFEGSVLLQQDNEGHCSFSAPSVCTASAARVYFQTGQLPGDGTICRTDKEPLGTDVDMSGGEVDGHFRRKVNEVVRTFRVPIYK